MPYHEMEVGVRNHSARLIIISPKKLCLIDWIAVAPLLLPLPTAPRFNEPSDRRPLTYTEYS
jgi:hypothetical protein